jgi:hypothetical protein
LGKQGNEVSGCISIVNGLSLLVFHNLLYCTDLLVVDFEDTQDCQHNAVVYGRVNQEACRIRASESFCEQRGYRVSMSKVAKPRDTAPSLNEAAKPPSQARNWKRQPLKFGKMNIRAWKSLGPRKVRNSFQSLLL